VDVVADARVGVEEGDHVEASRSQDQNQHQAQRLPLQSQQE
jgi:hypothetical protein